MVQVFIKVKVIALKVSIKKDKNLIMENKLENKEKKYTKGSLRIIKEMVLEY